MKYEQCVEFSALEEAAEDDDGIGSFWISFIRPFSLKKNGLAAVVATAVNRWRWAARRARWTVYRHFSSVAAMFIANR